MLLQYTYVKGYQFLGAKLLPLDKKRTHSLYVRMTMEEMNKFKKLCVAEKEPYCAKLARKIILEYVEYMKGKRSK